MSFFNVAPSHLRMYDIRKDLIISKQKYERIEKCMDDKTDFIEIESGDTNLFFTHNYKFKNV